MNKKLASAKKFVVAHKTALAVTATATTCAVVHVAIIRVHNNFLADHNLFDEFYATDEI